NIYNNEAPTLVFNGVKNSVEGHISYIKISKDNFPATLMSQLYEKQIQSVIVEGGRFTLQQFIDADLWDETIIIRNENLILMNGTKAPDFPFKASETQIFRDNTVEFYKNKSF